jgi:hypothetical protein
MLCLVLLFAISACGGNTVTEPTSTPSPPTASPTSPPPTTTFTATPSPGVYQSDLGFSFTYPNGWHVSSQAEGFLAIASRKNLQPMQRNYIEGDVVMEIIGVPPDMHAQGDPSAAAGTLNQFLIFMGLGIPDKEPVHLATLDGRDFLIGTYSENSIKDSQGSAPLFIAVYFTDKNTLIVDMYANPAEEQFLRNLFEDLLVSIKDTN